MGGTLERILHDVHNVHGLSLCERRERCVQRKRAFLFAMTWQRTKRGRFEPLLGQPKCTVDIWLRRWSSSRLISAQLQRRSFDDGEGLILVLDVNDGAHGSQLPIAMAVDDLGHRARGVVDPPAHAASAVVQRLGPLIGGIGEAPAKAGDGTAEELRELLLGEEESVASLELRLERGLCEWCGHAVRLLGVNRCGPL